MENPQMYPQIHQGSAKECEVDMVGEECEVKMVGEECSCSQVMLAASAPISPMLKRRISCGLEILN